MVIVGMFEQNNHFFLLFKNKITVVYYLEIFLLKYPASQVDTRHRVPYGNSSGTELNTRLLDRQPTFQTLSYDAILLRRYLYNCQYVVSSHCYRLQLLYP